MAGNHFKSSDSGRPAVPPRPNGAGKAGTPGGAGQGGSGKRVSPGETAMFTALYEQSQKAKKTGRARGNVFAGGATSTSQPSGAPSAPANNAGAVNAANTDGNVNAGRAANNTPSSGGVGLTGNLGTIYTGASETGTFARLDDSGVEFAGSGSKEDYYDFGLNYGGDASSSSTSDGLVRHRHRKGERKKRHTGAIIAAVVVVLLVALGASGFMLLNSAKTVKSEAKEAVEIVGGLKDKVTSGDFSTLPDDAKKIDELCDSMKAETSSPLWTAASFIPVYGSDINAARTMIDALSDVSSNALVPMADNLSQATPGKLFQDGTINVSALQAVADSLSDSSKVFKSANEKIQSIGDTHISQVTELVDKAKAGFATLNGAVDAAEKVAPVLPQMLGANGQTRHYLVLAMSNVEIRACGGFPGSRGVMSVTDGKLELGDFVKVDMMKEPLSPLPITDEEANLFTTGWGLTGFNTLGYTMGDVTMTPDYPRAAQLASDMQKAIVGDDIDGVFAVDPVFLQYMLGIVGGTQLPDGTVVDGSNAAKVLLHDIYWNYPVEEQDAIFAAVAGSAFNKIVNELGSSDITKIAAAIEKGASEGRILMYSRNDDEEKAAKALGISGALQTDTSEAPILGVYVNNYSYSKMDWFLDKRVTIDSSVENADGSTTYRVTTTLKNTMTPQEKAEMPGYFQGHNGISQDIDDEVLRLYLYAPAGGSISDIKTSGSGSIEMNEATHDGLKVAWGGVHMLLGQDIKVEYTVTTSKDSGHKELKIRTTPTAQTFEQDK
ncbi:DUF4012 domain-containing protein [Collinsella sp. BIOML-A4]|uniref:DUF4012 domain-containing protein n=1 Tax=unclassified Collinsella TaxID=2637548 RepID=UPI00136C79E0|nr:MULTISPECIES: DUF4012 domain-containing protein [unclassified Collinsella]MZJ33505.1 DUF4012 domain-containing protein [Collinsella sp. BIOML-A1]MZJ27891.1 DUF4012 domain-containing protein [Collinsella sp. BIOML-A2]MZJ29901.1 DUF4012 domain-containing protein [Collinsella sp. BIOML-A3]MZJ97259.1 DUF4012 domain-containing protein [Collinsella sp. BIOML-A6]MZK31101.1 DUF4012 domain-containing protein [Collinsella sp. BIOML-A5]